MPEKTSVEQEDDNNNDWQEEDDEEYEDDHEDDQEKDQEAAEVNSALGGTLLTNKVMYNSTKAIFDITKDETTIVEDQ